MIKKVVYNGLRKEKNEEHCLIPSANLLQKKNLKYRYLKQSKYFVDFDTKFFRVKTKKPTRVIIKAPFHYKKGKHRLTLRSYRYVKYEKIPTMHSKVPSKMLEVIQDVGNLVSEIPSESTSVLQPKYTKLYVNYAVNKNFFLF